MAMQVSQARENLIAALDMLRSSKVRSALTILGIVIGVSSVISMAAIIQGLNKFVQDKVESLGSRTYFVSRFPPGSDPGRWPESIRTRKYFEYSYADYIRSAAPNRSTRMPFHYLASSADALLVLSMKSTRGQLLSWERR